jgi:hypothetical protein
MIIWLASYPRSGTSLAILALRRFFGLQTRIADTDRDSPEIRAVHELLGSTGLGGGLEPLAATGEPCIVTTHGLPGQEGYPAIHLVRDGRDALVSYAHFVLQRERGIPAGSNRKAFLIMLEQLIAGEQQFGGWSGNVLAWRSGTPAAVTIRFEDLVGSPASVLQGALAGLGLQHSIARDEPLPSFASLHEAHPWFFRAGATGGWRLEMPESLHRLFWDRHGEAMAALGYTQEGIGVARKATAPAGSSECGPGMSHFSSAHYQQHNSARLRHLETLGLPLKNARVLELGSGPGDHTGFYVERDCAVVSVDSRQECLDELVRRFPGVQTIRCDLNEPEPLKEAGRFDIIHCYGILYHLETPGKLLACMGEVCDGIAIVETCVSPESGSKVEVVEEVDEDYTQSSTGHGSRPTRQWVFEKLREFFPYVYQTRSQPVHPEFPVNWSDVSGAPPLIRAVFVGSKRPLELPSLSPEITNQQFPLTAEGLQAGLEEMQRLCWQYARELTLKEEALGGIVTEAARRLAALDNAESAAAERLRAMNEKDELISWLHLEAAGLRAQLEAAKQSRKRSRQRTAILGPAEEKHLQTRLANAEKAAEERLRAMNDKDELISRLHTEAAGLRAQLEAAEQSRKRSRQRTAVLASAAEERLQAMLEKERIIAELEGARKRQQSELEALRAQLAPAGKNEQN